MNRLPEYKKLTFSVVEAYILKPVGVDDFETVGAP
jgi:hypothetical protein